MDRLLLRVGPMPGIALIVLLLGAVGVNLYAAAAPAEVDCAACHDVGQKLAKSAHADLPCDTCHENYIAATHPAGITKPACATCHPDQAGDYALGVHGQARKQGNEGAPDCSLCHGAAHELLPPRSQAFRAAVPDTCGMCHTDVVEQYRASVHGQALARGVTQAPLCTDCHGEHKIIKPSNADSTVNAAHIRDTCGSCHGDVRLTRKFGLPSDRVMSFDASYHGLAAKAGSQTVANCASCHGVHNILPSSDPKSTINPKNLAATCGKCHVGASANFAQSKVHVDLETAGDTGPVGERINGWVRRIYLALIFAVVGLMAAHNALLFGRKAAALQHRAERTLMRMDVAQRWQHFALAASFIVLAWTGFALKFPDSWVAHSLVFGESFRRWSHRIAGVVMLLTGAYHLGYVAASREGRRLVKDMMPRLQDARDAAANSRRLAGLGGPKPRFGRFGYAEKMEYWAVVWGTVIMGTTGLMIWFKMEVTRFLPRWVVDVATTIHYYEAILACLAILVWHFYHVIFDPDVYPLNRAVLDGRVSRHWLEEEHPLDPALAGPQPPAASGAASTPAASAKRGEIK